MHAKDKDKVKGTEEEPVLRMQLQLLRLQALEVELAQLLLPTLLHQVIFLTDLRRGLMLPERDLDDVEQAISCWMLNPLRCKTNFLSCQKMHNFAAAMHAYAH